MAWEAKKNKLHLRICITNTRSKCSADENFPAESLRLDLLPRHFINSVQLADSTSTTHLYYDYYDVIRDRLGRTTQAGAADVPATSHRLMD